MDQPQDDRPEPPADQDLHAVSPELDAILASAPPPPARPRAVVPPPNRYVQAFRAAEPRRRPSLYIASVLAVGLAGLIAGVAVSQKLERPVVLAPPPPRVAPATPIVPAKPAAAPAPEPRPAPAAAQQPRPAAAEPAREARRRPSLRRHARPHRMVRRQLHRPARPRPRLRRPEAEAATAALNRMEPRGRLVRRPRRGYPFEGEPPPGAFDDAPFAPPPRGDDPPFD